jgi:hypothetical protein
MKNLKFFKLYENFLLHPHPLNKCIILHSRAKSMNEITWHEGAIWFFIAQKLLFANQC